MVGWYSDTEVLGGISSSQFYLIFIALSISLTTLTKYLRQAWMGLCPPVLARRKFNKIKKKVPVKNNFKVKLAASFAAFTLGGSQNNI